MNLRMLLVGAFLGFALCGSAFAEQVVVRAGEHGSFTRLVLNLPAGSTWKIESALGKRTILFDNYGEGFDTQRVFDVIPRTRLRDLFATNSSIELVLDCECKVNAFVEAGNYLVLDVLDGPALPTSSQFQNVVSNGEPIQEFGFGELLWSNLAPQQNIEPGENQDIAVLDEVPPDQPAEALSSLNAQLIQSVGRAASRGILDIAPTETQSVDVAEPTQVDPEVFDSSVLEYAEPSVPKSNIRISNSRDVPAGSAVADFSFLGASCPNPEIVNLPTWGSGDDFNQTVPTIRANLFNDLGRLDEETADKLAKTYLFYGFGAEARQVLGLSDALRERSAVLLDLVEIFENGYVRNPRVLHRFVDCDSDLAFWSILAARELDGDQPVDVDAALRGLSRQPDHLRVFLAPALADLLLQIGETEAAAHALRNAGPKGAINEQVPSVAEVKLSYATGDTDTAEVQLNELAVSGAPESPLALIETIDLSFSTGGSLAPDLSLLAQAYAVELRNTDLGPRMLEANILAAALTGQFELAFSELELSRLTISEADYAEQLSKVFSLAENKMDDLNFLETVFARFPTQDASLENGVVLDVADRLVSLGFAEYAMELLTGGSAETIEGRGRLLAAKASLDLGRAPDTIAYLDGLTSDESLALRARAQEMIGNRDEAIALYRNADEEKSAVEASWLSEDWMELVPSSAPVYGELRDIAHSPMPVPTVNPNSLMQSESLLFDTEKTRQNIERLLKEISKPAKEPS